jgi:hypothetical protein
MESKDMEYNTPEHWLTDTQIGGLKHHAMGQMIQKVLTMNPNASLFGGAARDMVLEAYQFGDNYQTWREFDKEKSVVSKDLDFMVTSEKDFNSLKDFFASYYHVTPKESEYLEMDFAVYEARVPLIVGTVLNDNFCIFVDLVYRKEEQRVDFDVNTLLCNHSKGFFVASEEYESKLEYLLRFTKIVQHVQTKTAHFVKPSSSDAKWLRTRQNRGLAMMQKGWKLCFGEDVYTLGPAQTLCHLCSKMDDIVFRCVKKEKYKEEVLAVVSSICHNCWLDYNVHASKVIPDVGVVSTSLPQ